MMQRIVLAALVAASLAALAVAYAVQYGLGYPPCALCETARWPHYAVIALGGLCLYLGATRAGLAAVMLALVVAFAVSLRHVGVEAGWLTLPSGCTVDPTATPAGDLRRTLMAQTQPSCDQPGPMLLGVSMPMWHAAAALVLAAGAALALTLEARRR